MALPIIQINSGTGSDTAASGAGPATALFGTGASLNATTAVNLSADAPDLSGVAVDGSAALWVDTTSGRQYSRITAVDNGTKVVTVATAYGVTEATRNWGIGGKRATLNHADTKTLGADAEPGWIIEIAAGDTQTLTSTFTWSASGDTTTGRITVRGASGTRAIVTSATNSVALFTVTGARVKFSHLNLTHTAATRGNGIASTVNTSDFTIITDCVIDGCQVGVSMATASPDDWWFLGNEVKNCVSNGVTLRASTSAPVFMYGNYIHDNGGDGVNCNATLGVTVQSNVIVKNTGNGFVCGNVVVEAFFFNNTIADNGGDGVDIGTTTSVSTLAFSSNLIYGNGAWGIVVADTLAETEAAKRQDTNNAFGSNSSGARSGISAGDNEVTLTANPFTNDSGANRDFSLNNTAGGGAACRAAGFPGAFVGASFVGYPDIGAVQHQDAGGGAVQPLVIRRQLVR